MVEGGAGESMDSAVPLGRGTKNAVQCHRNGYLQCKGERDLCG